ncbi:hypothetical protein ACQSSU_31070 [Micromonospora echinospora]
MSEARWVVHLPTQLTDRAAVAALVVALRESLAHVPVLDFGECTVSEEDDQSRRIRIWCDLRTTGGRCVRPAGHPGPCGLSRPGSLVAA